MTTTFRRSTRFSFTLLALFIFVQLAHAERRERLIDAWQPLDYDITLVLNDQLSEITKASAALNINVLKGPLSLVDLDFGEMTVDAVKVNSQDARFEQRAGKLLVTLPNAAKAGERLMVVVQYHGRPKDGLILTKDKTGKPSATGDNWPDRVHHWIPCLDHPSAKATVRFTVTAPQRTLVVANGQLTSKRDNEGGTRTWIYTEKKPIPPYCMVIAVGEFALLEPERRAVHAASVLRPAG